mmetsp:Transcript_2642/g.3533  ORF Transcript_2642/g.3533 Transcript_2642/m.3533 type:complete len:86 (-) Transcript_2642:663-920(-)
MKLIVSMVTYDVPRNTNHKSIGGAALASGYRGNCRLEEHCLNGRLKTVTAYFGIDRIGLLNVAIARNRLEAANNNNNNSTMIYWQ